LSVAFTEEDSAETASETLLPDRPVSPHPNLVTEAGLKALEFQLHQARGYRAGAAPGRRQQNYPRTLQIALQRHRRTATPLKHLAISARKVDFSCFGYHPDLESRLTL
jgi:hypothetical protein